MKKCLLLVLTAATILVLYNSCRRPDHVRPNDNWCTSGINVWAVNDDNVPSTVKDAIYKIPPNYTGVGSSGYNPNLPIVIIPFQFKTAFPMNSAITIAIIRNAFFSTGTGSVRDYFLENSWGQYNIMEGFIASKVGLSEDTTFYKAGGGGDWTANPAVAREICENSNVNWASIDVNGNHIISRNEAQICFMLSAGQQGANRSSSFTISTQRGTYTIENSFVFFDCKRDNDPTKGTNDISYNYSTIWHEMSHGMFGLPDRYAGSCGTGRTGEYDIMSDNCTNKHMSIYDKMKIGWIRPRILVKPSQRSDGQRHCYTFPNSEAYQAALILWDNNQPDEFWIVENRYAPASASSFETGLPESGLAIWWADEKTHTLSLVSAGYLDARPQTLSYVPGAQIGALFKNRTGRRDETYGMQFLRSGSGSTEFAIRAVSPEGLYMFAEF